MRGKNQRSTVRDFPAADVASRAYSADKKSILWPFLCSTPSRQVSHRPEGKRGWSVFPFFSNSVKRLEPGFGMCADTFAKPPGFVPLSAPLFLHRVLHLGGFRGSCSAAGRFARWPPAAPFQSPKALAFYCLCAPRLERPLFQPFPGILARRLFRTCLPRDPPYGRKQHEGAGLLLALSCSGDARRQRGRGCARWEMRGFRSTAVSLRTLSLAAL